MSPRTAKAAKLAATSFTTELAAHIHQVVTRIAGQPDVQAAVEANHDNNRWWPVSVADWRLRMAMAGWSTRVSYHMIDTYARVVAAADRLGYDHLAKLDDTELGDLLAPLGLTAARIRYFRSLDAFLAGYRQRSVDPRSVPADRFISDFAGQVDQAGYKVAQCATLYARGYHCDIIPVDSGMVAKLAPLLGITLTAGPVAHEQLRRLLQGCAKQHADAYRQLIDTLGYKITVPDGAIPSWWLHLTLIYFKRLYLNRPGPRLCPSRPACTQVLDCTCAATRADVQQVLALP